MQLINSQSATFTHRAQFSRFDEVAQFMQARRSISDEPLHSLDPEQPADEITIESGEEQQSPRSQDTRRLGYHRLRFVNVFEKIHGAGGLKFAAGVRQMISVPHHVTRAPCTIIAFRYRQAFG